MGSVPPGSPPSGSYQPIVITGQTGPNQPASNLPGENGFRTAQNVQQAQGQALQYADRMDLNTAERAKPLSELSVATIQFNDPNTNDLSSLIMNAAGYAQGDLDSIKNPAKQSNTVDINDLTSALGTNAAQNVMKAEDFNKDGAIGLKEHTTYILFQDHPTELMAGTLNAFAQTPNAVPGQDPGVLREWANQFANGTDSQTDGQITGGEKHIAEQAVNLAPTFVNTTLQQMYKTLNISNVVDQGMDQGGGPGSPNPFSN